ncbi:sperm acrosome-associated protein 7 isoform X2 [Tupaia chinensis]|nr:sperm acrosome-associated protein 7 isoform X2 [Tupaia chinensis]
MATTFDEILVQEILDPNRSSWGDTLSPLARFTPKRTKEKKVHFKTNFHNTASGKKEEQLSSGSTDRLSFDGRGLLGHCDRHPWANTWARHPPPSSQHGGPEPRAGGGPATCFTVRALTHMSATIRPSQVLGGALPSGPGWSLLSRKADAAVEPQETAGVEVKVPGAQGSPWSHQTGNPLCLGTEVPHSTPCPGRCSPGALVLRVESVLPEVPTDLTSPPRETQAPAVHAALLPQQSDPGSHPHGLGLS